jgi:hypothetical protein
LCGWRYCVLRPSRWRQTELAHHYISVVSGPLFSLQEHFPSRMAFKKRLPIAISSQVSSLGKW